MTQKRAVKNVGDGYRWFAQEDGKNYRGYKHNMAPLIKSVKRIDQKVNDAPRMSNQNEWQFRARAHMSQIYDWCRVARYTPDQWARNEDGARDKFWKWFEATNTKQCADNIRKM